MEQRLYSNVSKFITDNRYESLKYKNGIIIYFNPIWGIDYHLIMRFDNILDLALYISLGEKEAKVMLAAWKGLNGDCYGFRENNLAKSAKDFLVERIEEDLLDTLFELGKLLSKRFSDFTDNPLATNPTKRVY